MGDLEREKMKRKLSVIAAAALATGLLAAGCGDDDDDSSELTHAEFVAEANQICKTGNAEINAAGEEANPKPGTPEFDAFVTDTLVPNVQGQIDDIRALGIPEEDESLGGTLDEAELIVQDLSEDPASILDGDPFAPIDRELTDAGLTECAS
jgi:hypothetical protein